MKQAIPSPPARSAILLSLCFLLAACGQAAEQEPTAPSGNPPASQPGPGQDTTGSADLPSAGALAQIQRKVAYDASLALAVENVGRSAENAAALAAKHGGYVLSSRVQAQDAAQPRAEVALRVPSQNFNAALDELRKLAVRVDDDRITSQDVTDEFVDLGARLTNLSQTEAQLLQLMERAQTVEEVLRVQREVTTVRGEIERIKGRMQYLTGITSESKITVSMYPVASTQPIVAEGWSAREVLKDATRNLVVVLQGLAEIGIRLLVFLPVWLPIAALVYWGIKRQSRRPKVLPQTPPPPAPPTP